MRLLRYDPAVEKWHIENFHGRHVPLYAVLSHTWGPDHEEVSFEDLRERQNFTHRTTHGYNKLHFTRLKAQRDGLLYLWVDTCCIKKSDSTELQRSLNSMFYWYQQASKCYVWLEDVTLRDFIDEELPWKTAFSRSRWFKRGWTLQELIAPKSVAFYSREGKFLGTKNRLAETLSAVTGIPTSVLHGADISRFSKESRFSWAQGRTTKIPEDAAYSLIGIFGVTLPMLYADGNYNRRRQAALDELDIAIARTESRHGRQQDVVRIGGASYEDIKMLSKAEVEHLDADLDVFIDWVDGEISMPTDMTSEELLGHRVLMDSGYPRLEVEEKLETLLQTHRIHYEFEVHRNQPVSFDIHSASSFDKLQWLEDAWHIFGYTAAKTVLDLKIWIKQSDLR
jgi:hypothetical protein